MDRNHMRKSFQSKNLTKIEKVILETDPTVITKNNRRVQKIL